MTAVAVAAALEGLTARRRVASVQDLLRGLPARLCRAPRAAFAWATLSRRWMGDLVEALDRELPAVANLAVRLAIDLEVDQDIITQACS